jgi:transcriptional regulator with XRE-family HTH domain
LELGARIRAARQAQSISLSALGAKTGLSKGFLSQVENGASTPSISSVRKLSQALEIPLSTLLEDAPASDESVNHATSAIQVSGAELVSSAQRYLPTVTAVPVSAAYFEFTPGERLEHSAEGLPGTDQTAAVLVEGAVQLSVAGHSVLVGPGEMVTFSSSDHFVLRCSSESAKVLLLMPEGSKMPCVVRAEAASRPTSQPPLPQPTGPYRLVEMRAARGHTRRVG